jgi:hypothetical protein
MQARLLHVGQFHISQSVAMFCSHELRTLLWRGRIRGIRRTSHSRRLYAYRDASANILGAQSIGE